MLEIRPYCEHCGKHLAVTSTEAMICSFECTYCQNCAKEVFQNVCPSCGGNFEKRPIRPSGHLEKHPPSHKKIVKPKSGPGLDEHILKYKNIPPEKR